MIDLQRKHPCTPEVYSRSLQYSSLAAQVPLPNVSNRDVQASNLPSPLNYQLKKKKVSPNDHNSAILSKTNHHSQKSIPSSFLNKPYATFPVTIYNNQSDPTPFTV